MPEVAKGTAQKPGAREAAAKNSRKTWGPTDSALSCRFQAPSTVQAPETSTADPSGMVAVVFIR